jgi:hypothetical protein
MGRAGVGGQNGRAREREQPPLSRFVSLLDEEAWGNRLSMIAAASVRPLVSNDKDRFLSDA